MGSEMCIRDRYRHPTLKFNRFRVWFADDLSQQPPTTPAESPYHQSDPHLSPSATRRQEPNWYNCRAQIGEMWFDEV